MALDRQSIEKRDFPIARRGYDPDAVDAHLARLAAEVDTLQRQQAAGASGPAAAGPSATASLALAASEQVRMIVEAAEISAADIERSAQVDAEQIRADAAAAASDTRDSAVVRSQEHVGAVSEATTAMLQRVTAMESEIGALTESLRTGANRLNADLSLLQGNMGELYGAAGGGEPAPPPLPPPVAVEPALAAEPVEPSEDDLLRAAASGFEDAAAPAPPAEEPVAPPPEVEAPAAPPAEPPAPPAEPTAADSDVEGARLIALNMALNGQGREEIDAYLAANFDLADRAALLDEVYATVDG